MKNKSKVTVISISRFHLFRMAEFLSKKDLLAGVITAYPSFVATKKWPFMKKVVVSMPLFALFRFIVIYLKKIGLFKLSCLFQRLLHTMFSRASGKKKVPESEVIIGLSSFMEEVMELNKDKVLIVDHGSLHISTEKKELLPECDAFGFKKFGNWQHEWLISKMTREFEMADYVICCSELAKQTMINNGVCESKIFVNPLGVDLSSFYINDLLSSERFNHPFRFLHVSNMSPLKGLHYIIKTFNELDDTLCELWLVGPFPTEPLLQEMIKSNSRIKYCGYINEENLVNVYNQCDLFLHPSLSDGWAMTVLQAMASGLPVVVSHMTGVKEVVINNHNGWIINSKSTLELKDIMEYGLKNRDSLKEVGLNAANTISNKYEWSNYGKRLTTFLDSIS